MSDLWILVQQLPLTGGFWWVWLLIAVLALAFINASRWSWLIVLTVWVVGFTFIASSAGLWSRIIAWPLVVLPWVMLAVPQVRRRIISHRVIEHLRARLPQISRAELVTLRSGSVWWESEFFGGAPAWQQLVDEAVVELSDHEKRFLNHNVPALCDALSDIAPRSGRARGLPAKVLGLVGRDRFFGMHVAQRHAGLAFSRSAISAVLTRISTRHPALALTVVNGLAVPELISRFATDQQKDMLLPALARGEHIGALALAGPEAGSDLSAMSDQAIVSGSAEDLAICLDFDKHYVALCNEATHLVVAARVVDAQQLLGRGPNPGLTLFVVPADSDGVDRSGRNDCLDQYYSQGSVSGRGVCLDCDAILGGIEGLGRGWHMLSELHTIMRALGAPAIASGAAKRVSRISGAYARIRFQFREPIGFTAGVQSLLARIGSNTYALEAVRRVTMAGCREGREPAVVAAISRHLCAGRLRAVLTDAMELLGPKALCRGPRNLLDPYVALPSMMLNAEGTDTVSRNLTVYGQGMMRSHPFVAREFEAVRDTDRLAGEARFDALFGQHIGFAARNFCRTVLLSVAGGGLAGAPLRAGWGRRWFRRLSRMSAAFALTNDALLALFGGDLKKRQRESARMADILGDLYTATAVLKFHRDQGSHNDERVLVEYVLTDCLWRIQCRFEAVFANLPRVSGWLLRRVVFPFGLPYRPPSDASESSVASLLLVPSAVRNRITGGIAFPATSDAALNLLEQAHAAVVNSRALYQKLNNAYTVDLVRGHNVLQWLEAARRNQVLNEDEAQQLADTEKMRLRALAVDAFGEQ